MWNNNHASSVSTATIEKVWDDDSSLFLKPQAKQYPKKKKQQQQPKKKKEFEPKPVSASELARYGRGWCFCWYTKQCWIAILLFTAVGIGSFVGGMVSVWRRQSGSISSSRDNDKNDEASPHPTTPLIRATITPSMSPTVSMAPSSLPWLQIGSDFMGYQWGDMVGGFNSVAFDSTGTQLAIGAAGSQFNGYVNVYHLRTESNSTTTITTQEEEEEEWIPMGTTIHGPANELFGHSVAMSNNNVLVVGSSGYDDFRGRVFVYDFNNVDYWTLRSEFHGVGQVDRFGHSTAISSDGSVVAMAAPCPGQGHNAGYVNVVEWNTTHWQERGPVVQNGGDAATTFGEAISLSANGSILAVGAPGYDRIDNPEGSGHVQVYEWTSAHSWQPLGSKLMGTDHGDLMGADVALSSDGTVVACGAPTSLRSGYVQIFEWTSGEWKQRGSDIHSRTGGGGGNAAFGNSISLSGDGNTVVIGAPGASAATVWKWNGASWQRTTNMLATSNGIDQNDAMGARVQLTKDGTRMAIGSPAYSGTDVQSGLVRVYQVPEGNEDFAESD